MSTEDEGHARLADLGAVRAHKKQPRAAVNPKPRAPTLIFRTSQIPREKYFVLRACAQHVPKQCLVVVGLATWVDTCSGARIRAVGFRTRGCAQSAVADTVV